jgi:hypothetical protein
MGGINFGWLAVWYLSPDWLKPDGYATIIRRLGEADTPGERGYVPCADFAFLLWNLSYN